MIKDQKVFLGYFDMKRLVLFILIFSFSTLTYSQSSEITGLLDVQENLLLNLDKQISELQNNFVSISLKADLLAKDNQEIQSSLNSANTTIMELQSNLKQYKEALFSNKDDTAYIITLFADAQNEIEQINKKLIQQEKIIKIQKRILYIGLPVALVVGSITGSIVTYNLKR